MGAAGALRGEPASTTRTDLLGTGQGQCCRQPRGTAANDQDAIGEQVRSVFRGGDIAKACADPGIGGAPTGRWWLVSHAPRRPHQLSVPRQHLRSLWIARCNGAWRPRWARCWRANCGCRGT